MALPTVTCIMPVLNGEAFIEAAVRSVFAQTARDWDLVVVDNGSTDGTPQVLERLAKEDPRLRSLREPERGIVSALNRGLNATSAPYVARLDADDLAMPARFERQLAAFARNPDLVLVASRYELWNAATNERRLAGEVLSGDALYQRLLVSNVIAHPSVMMRRDAVVAAGQYRAEFAPVEDLDLWLRLGKRGPMSVLDDCLLTYRIHPGQVTAQKSDRAKLAAAATYAAAMHGGNSIDIPALAWTFVETIHSDAPREHLKIAGNALAALHKLAPDRAAAERQRILKLLLKTLRLKDARRFHANADA
jgi:glycosyltransferase involved in cell wall biosynthesis